MARVRPRTVRMLGNHVAAVKASSTNGTVLHGGPQSVRGVQASLEQIPAGICWYLLQWQILEQIPPLVRWRLLRVRTSEDGRSLRKPVDIGSVHASPASKSAQFWT
eukprot:6007631-Prymnesium_polylepis.1